MKSSKGGEVFDSSPHGEFFLPPDVARVYAGYSWPDDLKLTASPRRRGIPNIYSAFEQIDLPCRTVAEIGQSARIEQGKATRDTLGLLKNVAGVTRYARVWLFLRPNTIVCFIQQNVRIAL